MPTTLKNGMFVTPPIRGNRKQFTIGSKYKVSSVGKSFTQHLYNFEITDDFGKICYCLLNNCAHINNLNWKIVEL